MKKGFIFFLITSVAFIPLFSNAQKLLSVEEAIAAALQNNYDIQLLKNDSTAFALDNSYAKFAFYPRVNGSTGLLLNNVNQKQKLADASLRKGTISSDNITASVGLNWTIFDGFKMFATRDKQKEFIKLGELNIKNQIINTVAAVVTNYYNIVRQKQQQKAIQEQMGLNEERLKQAEKRFSVGLGAKPDILQAKTDLNAQKASLLQQQTFIEQLKEQLNLLTAAPINTTYNVADSIPINNNLVVAEILNVAAINNPALQVAKQNITIATFTLKERKADRYPVINLNSAYNYGLSATIPIFNGYNTKRQIQQAQLAIDKNKIEYEKIKATNQIAISNAFKTYELQKKTLALEEENILLAKENVYIAMERFKLGISTTLELRETQKTLEDAFNRLIAARYNTKVAETELLRLKGELVK